MTQIIKKAYSDVTNMKIDNQKMCQYFNISKAQGNCIPKLTQKSK